MIILYHVNELSFPNFKAFSAKFWFLKESGVFFMKLWYTVLYHELESSMVMYGNQLDDLQQKECSDF